MASSTRAAIFDTLTADTTIRNAAATGAGDHKLASLYGGQSTKSYRRALRTIGITAYPLLSGMDSCRPGR